MTPQGTILADLYALGRLAEAGLAIPKDLLDRLAPHTGFGIGLYRGVPDAMTDEQLAALGRGLVYAEERLGWTGGSPSGVIGVFRALRERNEAAAVQLAEWVMRHSRNDYAPFGTSRGGSSSIAEYEAYLKAKARRSEEGRAQEAGQRDAALRRRAQAAEDAQARGERSHAATMARNARLAEMEAWPLSERLRVVAADLEHAPGWYPEAWAEEAMAKATTLETALCHALARRLASERAGVWERLRLALRH